MTEDLTALNDRDLLNAFALLMHDVLSDRELTDEMFEKCKAHKAEVLRRMKKD